MLAVNNPFEGWQPPSKQETARIARQESEDALEELAGHVRSQAALTPGWEPYAERLGVFHDGAPYVGLPPGDEDESKVFDLEYGTEDVGPSAFLRNTLDRHGPRISEHLGRRLTHRVIGDQ